MNIADVRPGRYTVRGDVVDVVEVVPGRTARSAQVRYILRVKTRPAGALEVGDEGWLGVVNFATWAHPTP